MQWPRLGLTPWAFASGSSALAIRPTIPNLGWKGAYKREACLEGGGIETDTPSASPFVLCPNSHQKPKPYYLVCHLHVLMQLLIQYLPCWEMNSKQYNKNLVQRLKCIGLDLQKKYTQSSVVQPSHKKPSLSTFLYIRTQANSPAFLGDFWI